MKRVTKAILKVLSILFVGITAVVLVSNIYILAARRITGNPNPTVFGFTSAVVLTGSMEDTILPNDMVIVHRRPEYEVNDIVMYRGNSSTVTHRIIELGENGYITKGDANNTDDGEIPRERVVGKVICIIPRVGAVISFFQAPLGMLILVLVLLLIIELPSLIKRKPTDD